MELLILFTIACAGAVSSSVVYSPYGSNVARVPPRYQAGGSDYLNQGYSHGASGSSGGGFQNQGSNSFYDQAENHHKTKQVIESQSSSKRNRGGYSEGGSSIGSFDTFNTYGQGSSRRGGSQYQQYGPRYI